MGYVRPLFDIGFLTYISFFKAILVPSKAYLEVQQEKLEGVYDSMTRKVTSSTGFQQQQGGTLIAEIRPQPGQQFMGPSGFS
jgi:hypothetical protein